MRKVVGHDLQHMFSPDAISSEIRMQSDVI